MARAAHENAGPRTGAKTTPKTSKIVKEAIKAKLSSPKKTVSSSKMADVVEDNEQDEHEPKRSPKKAKSSKSSTDKQSQQSQPQKKKKRASPATKGGVKKASSGVKRAKKAKEPKEPKEKEVDPFDAEALEEAGNQLSSMADEELVYDNPLLFSGKRDPHYLEKVNSVRSAVSNNPSALLPTEMGVMRIVKPLLAKLSAELTEQAREAKGDKYNEKKHAVKLRASKSFKNGLPRYLLNMALDLSKKSGTCAVVGQKKVLSVPAFIGAVDINDKYQEICDVDALMAKWRLAYVPPKPRTQKPKKATSATATN